MARGAPGVGRAAVPKSAHSRRVGSHVGLFRSEISCRRVPRRFGRLWRTQRVGVHAEAPGRIGVWRFSSGLGFWIHRASNLVVFLAGRMTASFRRSKTMHELRGGRLREQDFDGCRAVCGGRLSSWRVRRPNASSARALSLCVRRRRRGDAGRLGGGSGAGHSRRPGSRAGRWDNAPYRRWGTRRAPAHPRRGGDAG